VIKSRAITRLDRKRISSNSNSCKNLAERGGFSSGRPAHPFENAGNPHTMLKAQALACFPLRLSRTGKSAWCSPKIDTK